MGKENYKPISLMNIIIKTLNKPNSAIYKIHIMSTSNSSQNVKLV